MVEKGVFAARAERLAKLLEGEGLDGVIMVPGPNIRYFTGVESFLLERPFMLLFSAHGGPHLVAPELEAGPYRRSPLEISVHPWTDSEGPAAAIARAAKDAGFEGRWAVEGRAPFGYLQRLSRASRAKLEDGDSVLQGLREIKDEAEAKLLRRSAAILSKSFREFPELLKEGMMETDVAKAATDIIYQNGADRVDDMLVQSGARAADPHSLPSLKKVRRGESVVVDVGSTYGGYYSDITRTFCLGAAKDVESVYGEVLEAQERAIVAAKDGAEVGDVDGAARGVLRRAGHGKQFTHRTGHGLGLEIHEAPYIVQDGKEKLREGMCFTVEPGVYLTGRLGVRIEDDVLMSGKAGEEITRVPKDYGWWR